MNTHIEETLLEVEQGLKQLHKQIQEIRLELTRLKHSNKSIKSSKDAVHYEDDQNRRTARR